jgi:hypothetical protein
MGNTLSELFGLLVGFALTLFVFSYIVGDNLLFRVGIHVFIGAAAGYVTAVAWHNIVWPYLFQPWTSATADWKTYLGLLVPLGLSVLLLLRLLPRPPLWSSLALAFLVGVGAATVIGGALMGTLVPQLLASINVLEDPLGAVYWDNRWLKFLNAGVILISTIGSLVYFQFWKNPKPHDDLRQPGWIEGLAWIGKVSIVVSLAVLFSGVLVAALTALVDRMHFLITFITSIIRS